MARTRVWCCASELITADFLRNCGSGNVTDHTGIKSEVEKENLKVCSDIQA